MSSVRRWSWVLTGGEARLTSPGDGAVVAVIAGSLGSIGERRIVVRRSPDTVRLWDTESSRPLVSVTTDWSGRGTVRLANGRTWGWTEGAGSVQVAGAMRVLARVGAGPGIGDVEVEGALPGEDAVVLATIGLARLAGAAERPGAVVRSGTPRQVRSMFRA